MCVWYVFWVVVVVGVIVVVVVAVGAGVVAVVGGVRALVMCEFYVCGNACESVCAHGVRCVCGMRAHRRRAGGARRCENCDI